MTLAILKRFYAAIPSALLYSVLFCAGVWWGAHQTEQAWARRWAERDAGDAVAIARQQTENREEEQRRQREVDAIEKQSREQLAAVTADADRARDTAERLHSETKKLAARLAARERACRAGTAGDRQADATGSELLAELFRRADQRAGELAAIADQARSRGLSCEAAYAALSKEKQ
ncbi:DUF2514 family protein [Klebsiella aerogenes]